MSSRLSPILPTALDLPIFKKLANKRVVLASASPRRKDALETSGLRPEVIPSTFAEDLPKDRFESLADYPVATAGEKATEVYERLLRENDRDPADLVISADTVVIFPPLKETESGGASHGETSEVLEKPLNKEDQIRNLTLMAGRACEIITGVTIAYPCVQAPGFKLESISCSTICHFYDSPKELIKAYVEQGEGSDRAGGFAVQGMGGLLVDRIDGDFHNAVGFPLAQFWRWMTELDADGVFDEAWS